MGVSGGEWGGRRGGRGGEGSSLAAAARTAPSLTKAYAYAPLLPPAPQATGRHCALSCSLLFHRLPLLRPLLHRPQGALHGHLHLWAVCLPLRTHLSIAPHLCHPQARLPKRTMRALWRRTCAHTCVLPCATCPACRPALLVVQKDVTERVQLEVALSELTEAQLAMLSQVGWGGGLRCCTSAPSCCHAIAAAPRHTAAPSRFSQGCWCCCCRLHAQIFPRHVIEALSIDGTLTAEKVSPWAYLWVLRGCSCACALAA